MIYIISILIVTGITLIIMGNKIGEKGGEKIIDRVYYISIMYIIYYIYKIIGGAEGEERRIRIGEWNKEISREERLDIIIDKITIIMTGLIIVIGYIILKYSKWYINEIKFRGILYIFKVSMIILISNKNIIGIYMGWEWVGICSYILINYWNNNYNNNKSGIKALLYNKIGDIGIILIIISIYNIYNISNYNILIYNTERIITIGIGLGAIVKSAQYIMHPWLGDAMAGPTPVSALLHAATMVTAGIILLSRTMIYKDNIWEYMGYISIITIIFGGITSIVQNDIKRLIAYSTCSQLGYMFMILQEETPIIYSLYHLYTHAFYKALLFLCAGIIIHYSNNEQDMRRISISNHNFLYIYLLFSTLSLLSFPYTSGYYSKESIILSIDNKYLSILLSIGALFTILYSYKLIFMLYINNSNYSSPLSYFPLSLYLLLSPLYIGSIYIGYISYPYYLTEYQYMIYHNIYIQLLPIIAYCIYLYKGYNNITLQRGIYHIYNLFNNKSYIDNIINIISYKIIYLSYYLYLYIDKGILEYFGPRGIYTLLRVYNLSRISLYSKNNIILTILLLFSIIYILLL